MMGRKTKPWGKQEDFRLLVTFAVALEKGTRAFSHPHVGWLIHSPRPHRVYYQFFNHGQLQKQRFVLDYSLSLNCN